MRRYLISILILLSSFGLYAQEAQEMSLRRYEVSFVEMDFTTIHQCVGGLSDKQKLKLFKCLGKGPFRVDFCNSGDMDAKSYMKTAQWTMYNNDCNFKDGPYKLEDYKGKGALIVPDGCGSLTVYNSKGSSIIFMQYCDGNMTQITLRKKSKELYKAEGRFETEYADGSPFYVFVSGDSVIKKQKLYNKITGD